MQRTVEERTIESINIVGFLNIPPSPGTAPTNYRATRSSLSCCAGSKTIWRGTTLPSCSMPPSTVMLEASATETSRYICRQMRYTKRVPFFALHKRKSQRLDTIIRLGCIYICQYHGVSQHDALWLHTQSAEGVGRAHVRYPLTPIRLRDKQQPKNTRDHDPPVALLRFRCTRCSPIPDSRRMFCSMQGAT